MSVKRIHPSALTLLILTVGLGLAQGLAGCARRPAPEEKVPPLKILVMNFQTPPGVRENPRDIRGWWFGSSTIYQNPRAGVIMAERISAHLSKFSFINLFSRVDLKYYFARKRQNLRESFPEVSDEDLNKLMDNVPSIDFARELTADKVISGRIVENYLDENRTIHWWSSVIEVEVELTDVATGEVEWRKRYRDRDWLDSQFNAQDKIAEEIVEDLRTEYFRAMAQGRRPVVGVE